MIGNREPYREAKVLVEQAYVREAEAIRSAKVLAESDTKANAQIEELAVAFVNTHRAADMALLDSYAKSALGSIEIKLTSDEQEASRLIPLPKPGAAREGRGGGGGGGGAAEAAVAAFRTYSDRASRKPELLPTANAPSWISATRSARNSFHWIQPSSSNCSGAWRNPASSRSRSAKRVCRVAANHLITSL